jgi:Xaa-Pro aminopeptidase
LYLVGQQLEGAVLVFDGGRFVLYAHPPDPDEALWTGAQPTLEEIGARAGLECRPIDDFQPIEGMAALPPQDGDSAAWFADFLDREIIALSGDELEPVDQRLADAMIELRLRHDEWAIAQLRQAAQVTALAHAAGREATRVGIREAEVCAKMQAAIFGSGMQLAYAPIVTVRGEVLHNQRHDGSIEPGDLVLADVGAETPEGWAGDVTRVWPASGRFSSTQRALYQAVLAAQEAAIARVQPGVRYLDVHRVAGQVLLEGLVALGIVRGDPETLYAEGVAGVFFPHGVGHLRHP